MTDRSVFAPSRLVAAAVVLSAALAMSATLPGRTHGLGLATTRILADFPQINETGFARINLAATLIGSLFCLPCGWLIDRLGVRPVLLTVMAGLSGTVILMSWARNLWSLAACITLSRGLGQSMLSVLSITMLGKWFRRDAGLVMGVYAVLMTIFMAAATGGLAVQVTAVGWRHAWLEMGIILANITPLVAWLAFPASRSSLGATRDDVRHSPDDNSLSATLGDALTSGCFWIFALSISLFGLATAGVSLFQQLILAERGLSESVFHVVLIIGLFAGLAANLVGGWLLRRHSMATLLAIAMFLLAGSLAALPFLRTAMQAYVQGVVAGIAGGLLTVLFFAIWATGVWAATSGADPKLGTDDDRSRIGRRPALGRMGSRGVRLLPADTIRAGDCLRGVRSCSPAGLDSIRRPRRLGRWQDARRCRGIQCRH